METKQMTKKEIFAYLNNAKVICASEEETKKVQEKLFELDIEWGTTGKIINISAFLIYIDSQKLTYTNNMEWWVENDKKRIEASEILAIQIKEEDKIEEEIISTWFNGFFWIDGIKHTCRELEKEIKTFLESKDIKAKKIKVKVRKQNFISYITLQNNLTLTIPVSEIVKNGINEDFKQKYLK